MELSNAHWNTKIFYENQETKASTVLMDSEVQVHFEMLMPVTFRAFYYYGKKKKKPHIFTAHISDFIPAESWPLLE